MARTFEDLKQSAIQIRDEKTNKQNTATRIGTQMLAHLDKLEQDYLDKETTEGKFSELDGKIGFPVLQKRIEISKSSYAESLDIKFKAKQKVTIEIKSDRLTDFSVSGNVSFKDKEEEHPSISISKGYGIDTYIYEHDGVLGSFGFPDYPSSDFYLDFTVYVINENETPILEKIKDNKNNIEIIKENIKEVQKTLDTVPKSIKSSSNIDLSIVDKNDTRLAEFYDGHLRTKYFDSKKVPKSTQSVDNHNFYIQDEKGNVILKIVGGYIVTKHFDSRLVLDKILESFYIDEFRRIHYKDDTIPLNVIKESAGLASIFHSWVFIGDSYMSGEAQWTDSENKEHYKDIYEYSFGQILCSMIGGKCRGVNFSSGGKTTTGWIEGHITNSERGYNIDGSRSDIFVNEKAQAYLIELIINDCNSVELGNFDTDINPDDASLNASTFIGNYDRIIREIKKIQPNAHIFLLTHPGFNSVKHLQYTDAIRQMADRYTDKNVWLIDLNKYAPNININGYNNGHPTPAGYYLYALLTANYIDWIIRHNINKFMYVSLIGNTEWE